MNLIDWKKYALEMYGYEMISSFGADFDIADSFGAAAVQDTFNRAFAEWRTEYKFLVELILILNWKAAQHYGSNMQLAKLYADLWAEADAWACNNLQGKDLEYFYRVTD